MILQAPNARGAMSWLVVNTHPLKERFAVDNLNRRQFAAYCPMLLKHIRHARRSQLVLRAMFPAHVFAGVHMDCQRWRSILETPGVRAIMRSGELPSFLPTGFIEILRACEVDGKVVAPGKPDHSGQITEHGTDYSALITAMVEKSEQDRVLALIGLLLARKDK